MQIITSTGFGDSGSSAVTDLLSEYEGVKSYGSEWECTFLHITDGLGDLENAISEGHRLKVDFAIDRFLKLSKNLASQSNYVSAFKGKFYELSLKFIEELCDAKWKGMYEDKLEVFNNSLSFSERKRINMAESYYINTKSKSFDMYESDSWRPSYVPFTDMYYSSNLDKFYDCAKKYTKELFELAAEGAEKLYLDQLLPPISIEKYIKYIPFDTKVFVVDKDPRDLYLVENLYNGSRFVPFENVDTFIAWYKATREKSLTSNDSKSVYHCYLDDLVYDYENQLDRIEKFLGWNSEDHKEKLKKFDPSKSCVNTRLYEKYTNYESEIKKIENTIPELCKKNNGVIVKQQNNSNINFRLPVAEVLKKCDSIQAGEKNNTQKFRIAVVSTILIKNIRLFTARKGLMKKIKGLIKIIIGVFVFIPDLIINLCIIK